MKILNIVSTVTKTTSAIRKSQHARNIASKLEVNNGLPITSALANYYANARAKLADIYLERRQQGKSTYIVENNIEAFDSLPSWIQKEIKPSDIDYEGHIKQDLIKKIWENGKAAGKPGVLGYPPVFKGVNDEMLPTSGLDIPFLDDMGSLSNLDVIGETPVLPDFMDVAEPSGIITEIIQNIGDIL